ncbi:hypothetical protein [Polluticoccus soli]|uniref:hypothetical protein n=1 Tax=Polluticoccus soli TaxID=3034150 RepID=UPI0023E2BD34|nr:hypothetical protein [Flavipsychrobacter sp. JY13-12]
MKFVKFSILALALGVFVASCGNSETTEETTTTDTATMMPEATPAPVDTMTAAPATTDTTKVDTAAAAH